MDNQVELLLQQLSQCSEVIAEAYHHGRVEKTEANSRQIEILRQRRIIQPDVRDAFRLRSSATRFFNAVFDTDRLLQVGRVTGDNFSQLADLVDMYSSAFLDGRTEACDDYEFQIRESISDIADALQDELTNLETLVANKFGAVTTLAEKKKQNDWYQKRTKVLVDLLENFHFSDIEHRLAGHEELSLSFRFLLADRIPAFLQSLIAILARMDQFLFEFRQIEARARLVRRAWLFFDRNPGWEPKAWDEAAHPPRWLNAAVPLNLRFNPDVAAPECESVLVDIASKLPPSAARSDMRRHRPRGNVEDEESEFVIEVPVPAIKKAINAFFRDVKGSKQGLSAHQWWTYNPQLLDGIRQDIWILRVMSEQENRNDKQNKQWNMVMQQSPAPGFDGNLMISDVIISVAKTHD